MNFVRQDWLAGINRSVGSSWHRSSEGELVLAYAGRDPAKALQIKKNLERLGGFILAITYQAATNRTEIKVSEPDYV
jgi:hypothetical protein